MSEGSAFSLRDHEGAADNAHIRQVLFAREVLFLLRARQTQPKLCHPTPSRPFNSLERGQCKVPSTSELRKAELTNAFRVNMSPSFCGFRVHLSGGYTFVVRWTGI